MAETADRAAFAAARKVFVDGLLASRRAYELVIPRIPLAEMFDRRLGQWLADHGVTVHRGCRIRQIEGDGRRATVLVMADDASTRREFDAFIVAVPWHRVSKLLAEPLAEAIPAVRDLTRLEPAPIRAIHLWYDRPIMELPHAVLVGRLAQWVFRDVGWDKQTETLVGLRPRVGPVCEVPPTCRDLVPPYTDWRDFGPGLRSPTNFPRPCPTLQRRRTTIKSSSAARRRCRRRRAGPGPRRTGGDLAGGPGGRDWSAGGWSSSRRRRFPPGRAPTAAAPATDARGQSRPLRRLDGHRLAGNPGRGSPQRLRAAEAIGSALGG